MVLLVRWIHIQANDIFLDFPERVEIKLPNKARKLGMLEVHWNLFSLKQLIVIHGERFAVVRP